MPICDIDFSRAIVSVPSSITFFRHSSDGLLQISYWFRSSCSDGSSKYVSEALRRLLEKSTSSQRRWVKFSVEEELDALGLPSTDLEGDALFYAFRCLSSSGIMVRSECWDGRRGSSLLRHLDLASFSRLRGRGRGADFSCGLSPLAYEAFVLGRPVFDELEPELATEHTMDLSSEEIARISGLIDRQVANGLRNRVDLLVESFASGCSASHKQELRKRLEMSKIKSVALDLGFVSPVSPLFNTP